MLRWFNKPCVEFVDLALVCRFCAGFADLGLELIFLRSTRKGLVWYLDLALVL